MQNNDGEPNHKFHLRKFRKSFLLHNPSKIPPKHIILTKHTRDSHRARPTHTRYATMVKKQLQPRTEDRTVHLHKLVYKIQFKKRAPHAVKCLKKIAQKCMGTADVRVDQKLNKHLWSKGRRGKLCGSLGGSGWEESGVRSSLGEERWEFVLVGLFVFSLGGEGWGRAVSRIGLRFVRDYAVECCGREGKFGLCGERIRREEHGSGRM